MIDWTRVNELRAEFGAEDFAEVVELFLEEVEEEIAKLNAGADDLAATLHFLKGSALNLGFRDFSERCREAEGTERESLDIAAILTCYDRSKAEFLQVLQTSDAA